MKTLKVLSVLEPKIAKDGRNYKTTEFGEAPTYIPGVGLVKSNAPSIRRNIWEQGPKQADGTFGKGDPIYASVQKGDLIEGSIVRAMVAPYELNGRTVNSYASIIFGHELPEVVFQRQGHPMLNNNSTANTIATKAVETVLDAQF